MKRTVSSDRPFGALSDSISVSNPYLYWSTSIRRTCSTVSCTAGILVSPCGFKDRSGCVGYGLKALRRLPSAEAAQAAMIVRPLSSDSASFIQAFRKRSISASLVVGPVETRIAPRASAGSTPMAARTCEGCTFPDEQAEPDDTATPARSKAITAVSARKPRMCESRGVRQPLGPLAENDDVGRGRAKPGLQPLREAAQCAQPPPQARSDARTRRSKPSNSSDILGTAAQPALLTATTDQRVGEMQAGLAHQCADALRAADLVRRQRQKIGIQTLISQAIRPGAWTASTCRRPPASCTIQQPQESVEQRRSRYWPA